MAVKVLKGEVDISQMPVEYAPAVKSYNPRLCDSLGIEPVDGYVAMEN